MTNIEGHSETLLTLPVRLLVLSVNSFNLPNVEHALREMESEIGPANTSAIEGTTRRIGGRAGTAGLSPLGTSSSPTSVCSVRSPGSPSANTGTPGAKGQSQHVVLQNFFQSLLTTITKNRTEWLLPRVGVLLT